jgi:hypothetical protein
MKVAWLLATRVSFACSFQFLPENKPWLRPAVCPQATSLSALTDQEENNKYAT